MPVTMALFCTALIAAAVSAQTVPGADIPVTFDPAAKVRVLATALDDPADYDPERAGPKYDPKAYSAENRAKMQNMGRPNPQIWVQDYGKDRVFSITLGHGPDTIQYDGFRTLFARGTEWAATGKVTIKPYDKAADFTHP